MSFRYSGIPTETLIHFQLGKVQKPVPGFAVNAATYFANQLNETLNQGEPVHQGIGGGDNILLQKE